MSRQEKRRELKKQKRKQQRQQAALWSAQAAEAEVVDAEVDEEEALAKERAEHEEQERLWLLREEEAQREWLRKEAEEEAERTRKEEERRLRGAEDGEEDLEEGWEYVEDGPAEIIWHGNEIIVKKPRKKVRKGTHSGTLAIEDEKRAGPISNPLPPQSAAFSSYQADIQDVADQSTNFGTEKDQRNCPFYIKTGVCRFGVRCSRLHPVFNAACTLLMRSMYTGAGLALEPVESLEYTDEEVIQDYEEFYDDVHSEFIRFGEIVNFKVCRNSSPHLRGNVYVHYVSQESAMAAYNHMNGRFYAKKQISCEFVGVHKWKLAICGEFMRTYYKTCSHGTACNFLHCFENPRREYEWADTDRPPPRFWQRKMVKLFGHAHVLDKDVDEKQEKATRAYRESTHDRGRRSDTDRELMYDDGHSRRDRHMRESAPREDDHRRGRGDRERKYHEEEMKGRTRRGSSKKYDDDRQRRRHSREKSYDSRRREKDVRDIPYDDDDDDDDDDDLARDKNASHSMHGDEPGSINEERWTGGDHLETDKGHHREQRHRSTTYYEHNDDDSSHPGRYCPTPDHVSHHLSHRHRSRRRSKSPGSSHGARRSRSRDRSTFYRARSQDGYYSSEEQEDRHAKEARHGEGKKARALRHRHGATRSGGDIHDGHGMLGRRGDEVVGKRSHWSYPESEHHQEASSNVLVSDGIRSQALEGTVAGVVSDENGGGGGSSTVTGLSLDVPTDDVQKSTLGWQSWRKTKKVKLGLKEKPMRVII